MKPALRILALSLLALLGACRVEMSRAPGYTVEGAVRVSGQFPWSEDLTLLEAVRLAEPVEGKSDLERVELIRESGAEKLTLTIDVARMNETGDTSHNALVRAGDRIRVPAR